MPGRMDSRSPLTGLVVEVLAPDGTNVSAEAPVIVLEAMKMHHEVAAPGPGVVHDLAVATGDQVREGELLFRVEPRTGAGAEDAGAAAERDLDEVRPDLARRSSGVRSSPTRRGPRSSRGAAGAGGAPLARTSPTCATRARSSSTAGSRWRRSARGARSRS